MDDEGLERERELEIREIKTNESEIETYKSIGMMKGLIIHFFQGKENVAQCNGRNEVMNIKCPPESRLRRELHVRRVRKRLQLSL